MVRRRGRGTGLAEIPSRRVPQARPIPGPGKQAAAYPYSSAARTYSTHPGPRTGSSNSAAYTAGQQWSASSAWPLSTTTRWLSYQGER